MLPQLLVSKSAPNSFRMHFRLRNSWMQFIDLYFSDCFFSLPFSCVAVSQDRRWLSATCNVVLQPPSRVAQRTMSSLTSMIPSTCHFPSTLNVPTSPCINASNGKWLRCSQHWSIDSLIYRYTYIACSISPASEECSRMICCWAHLQRNTLRISMRKRRPSTMN